jgi:hypothetical protein
MRSLCSLFFFFTFSILGARNEELITVSDILNDDFADYDPPVTELPQEEDKNFITLANDTASPTRIPTIGGKTKKPTAKPSAPRPTQKPTRKHVLPLANLSVILSSPFQLVFISIIQMSR